MIQTLLRNAFGVGAQYTYERTEYEPYMKPVGSGVEECPRPVILIFAAFYLPGYKGGGPIRSLANLAVMLKDEFEFRIVTSDRDLGDRSAYPGIRADAWQEVAGARVFYLSPGPLRWWRIARLLLVGDFDVIYLNSFWSRPFSMLPIWLIQLGVARRIPVLLAPRGEFSAGSLGIKSSRKRCYLALVKALRLYRRAGWHASTELEKANIGRAVGFEGRVDVAATMFVDKISVACDLIPPPPIDHSDAREGDRPKTPGSLKVVFVARISPEKNLAVALRILAGVRGSVHFNIYGPAENVGYWAECRRLINRLPPNVQADYRGELPHAQVAEVFRAHHLLLFPTRGENFGHVIAEALLVGCPVLISDQTPWRQLREKGVGWDLPLDRLAPFQQAIQECVAMDAVTFQVFSQQASLFGKSTLEGSHGSAEHRMMFRNVLRKRPPAQIFEREPGPG